MNLSEDTTTYPTMENEPPIFGRMASVLPTACQLGMVVKSDTTSASAQKLDVKGVGRLCHCHGHTLSSLFNFVCGAVVASDSADRSQVLDR
mmetsp:Transcript_13935/g.25226  ORF Transcript_13935/g.25226 Transcript_13935/m.25226 type:complete len:91 (+) Transcript_13935:138-410(+)